jgi:hypothetical protein
MQFLTIFKGQRSDKNFGIFIVVLKNAFKRVYKPNRRILWRPDQLYRYEEILGS